jgi:general nucleoside transport system ATP-binding protein
VTTLSARGLAKSFGTVQALADADFELRPGEVHAIVGENGAGKSTLAKIVAGVHQADAGDISIDGRSATFRRRQDAIAAGIGFLPQTLSLVGALSLVENDLLGQKRLRADLRGARAKLAAAATHTGIAVPLDVPTGRLSLVERQMGELLVALAQDARFLLLDEPTSMLGPREVERLVRCLRDLAAGGVGVGLVTHRISEVIGSADRVTVLRGGRVVHHGPAGAPDAGAIARLMIGERATVVHRPDTRRTGGERLVASGLTLIEDDVTILQDISLSVASGEILAVAGVAGVAQPALSSILAGTRQPTKGRVLLDGSDITGAAASAVRLGLAYIPDERGAGVVPALSVASNASLLHLTESAFRKAGLRRPRAEMRYGAEICDRFGVRPPAPGMRASGLSGGNQQKLLLGRELDRNPTAIVAHGPTQGLDIAATASIHATLIQAASLGAAVVVISADLDELIAIADRIVVLSAGKIVDTLELRNAPFDAARIGRAMAVGQVHKSKEQAARLCDASLPLRRRCGQT